MKKRPETILFINQSSGYLMIDIVNAFQGRFTNRALAAGLINPRNNPLASDVTVEKIITYDRSSTIKRVYTWVIGFVQLLWLVKTRYRKAHLFLVSNPPLATLLPLFCSNPYSLLIYDVYPEALVEYKIFPENSFIVRKWKRWNKRIYTEAEAIFTLSKGMKALIAASCSEDKVTVVPVWTDNDFLKPITKAENPFLQEQRLQDEFIVMYSGNLGKTHELGVLVDLAEDLQNEGVFFLIIGGGDQYKAIEQLINNSGLSNIRLLPWQPTERIPFTLAAADIGIVSLGKEASLLSMPSKTFNLLSVGCPILAIANEQSALAELVRENSLGISAQANEQSALREFILRMRQDPVYQTTISANAIATSKQFGPENATTFVSTLAQTDVSQPA